MALFDRPFALTIGPQRSGTTWIYEYLRERGDVCLPDHVKEIFFFDRHFKKGKAFYESHFNPQNKDKIIVETAATLFSDPEAPHNVLNTLGRDVRLICPLRHPIDRAYSLYRHFTQYGFVKGSLKDAIHTHPAILRDSRYAEHLKPWFDVFGQENITIVFLEELDQDPEHYTRKLCDGMGLPYIAPIKKHGIEKVNYAVRPPSSTLAEFGQKMADFCRNRRLYHLVNIAKALGLKRLFFGYGKKPEDLLQSVTEKELLAKHLPKEIEKLEGLLGYKIPYWEPFK